ncbi:hypothetical protein CEXT_419681 [Caerostris extrusa]|uniref:Uncharacterized protein n=1 Tax=Caerostris extrusa TaxID=172846 RepID=A0AAV4W606_CAEEX|nr:hypothetical protein CEXT_419681 [Caerostris extrusa]
MSLQKSNVSKHKDQLPLSNELFDSSKGIEAAGFAASMVNNPSSNNISNKKKAFWIRKHALPNNPPEGVGEPILKGGEVGQGCKDVSDWSVIEKGGGKSNAKLNQDAINLSSERRLSGRK